MCTSAWLYRGCHRQFSGRGIQNLPKQIVASEQANFFLIPLLLCLVTRLHIENTNWDSNQKIPRRLTSGRSRAWARPLQSLRANNVRPSPWAISPGNWIAKIRMTFLPNRRIDERISSDTIRAMPRSTPVVRLLQVSSVPGGAAVRAQPSTRSSPDTLRRTHRRRNRNREGADCAGHPEIYRADEMLKHFHKYCDVARAGYAQAFFDGTPAKSAAPSLTPFVKML
jgi:hypothetical protein